MRFCSALIGLNIIFLLSGCELHPLPENFAQVNTVAIVKHIRCEARQALQDKIIETLLNSNNSRTKELAKALYNRKPTDPGQADIFNEVDEARLDPGSRQYLEKYRNSSIAYDFTFTMTEENNASLEANFLDVFAWGKHTVGFKGTNNRKRSNTRHFLVVDTFGDLAMRTLRCDQERGGDNYIYPITGNIGLSETINTFIDLTNDQNLAVLEKADAKTKVSTLAETLAFTTSFSGNLSPKLELAGLTRTFRVANGGLSIDATRSDLHQVAIGLSSYVPDKATNIQRVPPSLLASAPAIPASLTATQDNAVRAAVNERVNNFLNNAIIAPRQ